MVRETVILRDALLILEFDGESDYRLRYGDLVEYSNGRRRVRGGKWLPYQFRSVEQLRYDFEQDVRAAGGSLG